MLRYLCIEARLTPRLPSGAVLAVCCMVAITTGDAYAAVVTRGAVTESTNTGAAGQADIVNAKSFPLPQADAGATARARSDFLKLLTNSQNAGAAKSGFHPGSAGYGLESPANPVTPGGDAGHQD
jgi:hypothetical protein